MEGKKEETQDIANEKSQIKKVHVVSNESESRIRKTARNISTIKPGV